MSDHRFVLVMRHGEAESRAATDFDRRLTAAGRDRIRQSCAQLGARAAGPLQVVASPLTRARETAELVCLELGLDAPLGAWPELQPDAEPELAAQRVEAEPGNLLLVSHQPLSGRLIEHLTGERVAMSTATIACISTETFMRGAGRVEWVISP